MIFQKLCPDQSGVFVYVPTPLNKHDKVLDTVCHLVVNLFIKLNYFFFSLQSIDLLSTLDCSANPSEDAELLKLKKACILTTELVRKCMKLAIELIEAEAKDANNFMAYMHSEPDLILHCQEIENYCNNLLPTEKEEAEIGKSNY